MTIRVTSEVVSPAAMCDSATGGGRLRRAIVAQFRCPRGWVGTIAGWIMARRTSNVHRSLKTIELLGIEALDRVLEIGCGPGGAVAAAAKIAVDGHVLGVDHSKTMVAMASRRNSAAIAAGRLTIELGQAEDLLCRQHSFDKVYAVNVFQFWADPSAVLRRVRQCMAPDGRIAITHQPRNRGGGQKDTDAAASRISESLLVAGFGNITTSFIELQPVSAVCVMAAAAAK